MLLVLEASRNLARLSRAGEIPPAALHSCLERLEMDLEAFVLRDLTLDLCRGTTYPVVSTPRSLDLGHLRTALWFHERERLTRFITLDAEQAQAAVELGLPLEPMRRAMMQRIRRCTCQSVEWRRGPIP